MKKNKIIKIISTTIPVIFCGVITSAVLSSCANNTNLSGINNNPINKPNVNNNNNNTNTPEKENDFTTLKANILSNTLNNIIELNGNNAISLGINRLNMSESYQYIKESLKLPVDVKSIQVPDLKTITIVLSDKYYNNVSNLVLNNISYTINNNIIELKSSIDFFHKVLINLTDKIMTSLYNAVNSIVALDSTVSVSIAKTMLENPSVYTTIQQALDTAETVSSVKVIDNNKIDIVLSYAVFNNCSLKVNNVIYRVKDKMISMINPAGFFINN